MFSANCKYVCTKSFPDYEGISENSRIVWVGQLEKHLLHSIHVYVIELPNSESLEEILDGRHTVAASQLGAWVVQYECKAHLLLGREATL